MKSTKSIIFVIALCVLSFQTVAGDGAGKVTHLMVHAGDIVIFSVGIHNNAPPCSTVGDLTINVKPTDNTERGKGTF